jgi:hypothetical protein
MTAMTGNGRGLRHLGSISHKKDNKNNQQHEQQDHTGFTDVSDFIRASSPEMSAA